MCQQKSIRRRCFSLCFVLILFVSTASSEGLFPSLNELFGTAMPSIGTALERNPSTTGENDNGSFEEYRDFTYEDYTAFGAYLAGNAAEVKDTAVTENTFTVTLLVRGETMLLSYDWSSQTAAVIYPPGTRPEMEKKAVKTKASILPAVGGIMPSAQFAVGRRPDSEESGEKGITQEWANFTDADYSAFSTYLAQAGATLKQSSAKEGILTAVIGLNASSFTFTYDWHTKTATLIYPVGTSPEREKWNLLKGNGSILPKMDTIGKELPSMSRALSRVPDTSETLTDGSLRETYNNFDEADYKLFSQYLQVSGCAVDNYHVEDDKVMVIQLSNLSGRFTFTYDAIRHVGTVIYPGNSLIETAWVAPDAIPGAMATATVKPLENDSASESLRTAKHYFNNMDWEDPVSVEISHSAIYDVASFCMVGGYVTFGSYEQDNNIDNGREPIEWLVLDYDEVKHRVLLLSRYGLDAKPYNTDYADVTWEKCTLRKWLNDEFVNNAFNTAEQSAIQITEVDNSGSHGYGIWNTDGGNNTQDKIFLLSYAEGRRYLGITGTLGDIPDIKTIIAPTEYAQQAGAWTVDRYKTEEGSAAGWWWQRSPGHDQSDATSVYYDGSFQYNKVNDGSGCVRPALWINLESDIF